MKNIGKILTVCLGLSAAPLASAASSNGDQSLIKLLLGFVFDGSFNISTPPSLSMVDTKESSFNIAVTKIPGGAKNTKYGCGFHKFEKANAAPQRGLLSFLFNQSRGVRLGCPDFMSVRESDGLVSLRPDGDAGTYEVYLLASSTTGKHKKYAYSKTSLTVATPAACGSVAHGTRTTRPAFSAETVPFGQSCDQVSMTQTASCDNGRLSDWAPNAFQTCVEETGGSTPVPFTLSFVSGNSYQFSYSSDLDCSTLDKLYAAFVVLDDGSSTPIDNGEVRSCQDWKTNSGGWDGPGGPGGGERLFAIDSAFLIANSAKNPRVKFFEASAPSCPDGGGDYSGQSFVGRDMKTCQLNDTVFYGANLTGADLSGASLVNTNFVGAILTGAKFRGTQMIWANFSGASGADLTGASVRSDTYLPSDARLTTSLPANDPDYYTQSFPHSEFSNDYSICLNPSCSSFEMYGNLEQINPYALSASVAAASSVVSLPNALSYSYRDYDGDGYTVADGGVVYSAGLFLPSGYYAGPNLGIDNVEGDSSAWQLLPYTHRDSDGDGFTVAEEGYISSGDSLPTGYFANMNFGLDCDDGDAARNTTLPYTHVDRDLDGKFAEQIGEYCADSLAGLPYFLKNDDASFSGELDSDDFDRVLMSSAGSTSCAVQRADRSVRCWGQNWYGQLGDGSQTFYYNDYHTSTVSGITDAAQVAVGGYYACYLSTSGHVKCWGLNGYSNLGDGTNIDSSTPVWVTPAWGAGKKVVSIAVSESYTACAAVDDGSVWCWGNLGGLTGDGTYVADLVQATPTKIEGVSGAATVSMYETGSARNICTVLDFGAVQCWGQIYRSDLRPIQTIVGIEGTTDSNMAKSVSGSCAIMKDGSVRCWGENINGRLGIGDSNPSFVSYEAAHVPLLDGSDTSTTAVKLTSNGRSVHAITSDGSVYNWGYGPMYNGDVNEPKLRLSATGIIEVSSSIGEFACFMELDGGVK